MKQDKPPEKPPIVSESAEKLPKLTTDQWVRTVWGDLVSTVTGTKIKTTSGYNGEHHGLVMEVGGDIVSLTTARDRWEADVMLKQVVEHIRARGLLLYDFMEAGE